MPRLTSDSVVKKETNERQAFQKPKRKKVSKNRKQDFLEIKDVKKR